LSCRKFYAIHRELHGIVFLQSRNHDLYIRDTFFFYCQLWELLEEWAGKQGFKYMKECATFLTFERFQEETRKNEKRQKEIAKLNERADRKRDKEAEKTARESAWRAKHVWPRVRQSYIDSAGCP
jgi:hypothetical protein